MFYTKTPKKSDDCGEKYMKIKFDSDDQFYI